MPAYPDVWIAAAEIELRLRHAQAVNAAATVGPFVVLPPMDPEPVPPADDTVLETDAPVQPVAVSGERLRQLMAQFEAETLRQSAARQFERRPHAVQLERSTHDDVCFREVLR